MTYINSASIQNGQVIQANHILNIINAFNDTNFTDVKVKGTASFNEVQAAKLTVTGLSALTGSILGTASYALSASYSLSSVSASLALSASYARIALSSSYATIARSSSFATTASYALNAIGSGFPYTGLANITGALYVQENNIKQPAVNFNGTDITFTSTPGPGVLWNTDLTIYYAGDDISGNHTNFASASFIADNQQYVSLDFGGFQAITLSPSGSIIDNNHNLYLEFNEQWYRKSVVGSSIQSLGYSIALSGANTNENFVNDLVADGWSNTTSPLPYNNTITYTEAFIAYFSGSKGFINTSLEVGLGGFTGSLEGVASYAKLATYATASLSSSFAATASFVNRLQQTVTITGSIVARQTGFNASGLFTGETIGGIALTTTASNGFSVFTISNTLQIYDNTSAATRFAIASNGDTGINVAAPSARLHVSGTIRNDDSTGTPGGGTSGGGTPSNYYGSTGTTYLSEPTIWFKLNLDGADYYLPGYE